MALMQSLIDQQRSSGSDSIWGDPTLKLAPPPVAPPEKLYGTEFTSADLPKLLPGFRPDERPDVVGPYLKQLQARAQEAQTQGDEFIPHALRTNPTIANSQGLSTPGALYSAAGAGKAKARRAPWSAVHPGPTSRRARAVALPAARRCRPLPHPAHQPRRDCQPDHAETVFRDGLAKGSRHHIPICLQHSLAAGICQKDH
jgi:hypothetical protein